MKGKHSTAYLVKQIRLVADWFESEGRNFTAKRLRQSARRLEGKKLLNSVKGQT